MTTLPVHPGADAVLDAPRPRAARGRGAPAAARCACWPVPAPARPGPSPTASPTACTSGVYQPQRVLAVTFTARAAGEMRTRLRDLGVGGVQARTFHAAALRQLHYFWPQAIGGAAARGDAAQGARRRRGRRRGCGCGSTAPTVRDLASEIEWAKVTLLTPESYAAAATRPASRATRPGSTPRPWRASFAAYEEVKTERGVIDFEDVLLLMVGILREHDEVARAVRSQYRHFVVDEYQDVNPLQQTPARPVARRARRPVRRRRPGPDHLLVHRCLARAPARLPHAATRGAQVVELVRNYRSTPQVVGLANLVLRGPGGQRRPARSSCGRSGRRGPTPELLVARRRPRRGGDRRHAASPPWSRPGHPPSEIAVLFRTNGQCEAFESALAERGIPYLVRGGERFFARTEVREAIVLLRGAARSDDGVGAPAATSPATSCSAPAGAAQAADQRWCGPRALGVAVGAGGARRRPGRPRPARPACPTLVRELDERAVGPARAHRRGRHAGVAARGQGPGVGRRLPRRLLRRAAADHAWPTPPRPWRRSAGCSTSGSPAPASAS